MKTKSADKLYCNVREEVIKNRDPRFNDYSLKLFHKFITERYRIHIKKDILHESAPYTDDEVLKNYKFCNVRREHDRASKWLIDNISNQSGCTLNERIYKSIIFRLYNKVDTAELIKLNDEFFFDNEDSTWLERACNLINEGKKINSNYKFYTNAYKTGGTKVGMKSTLTWYYYQREVILKNYENKHKALLDKLEFYSNKLDEAIDKEREDKYLQYQDIVNVINKAISINTKEMNKILDNIKDTNILPNKLLNESIIPNLPLVKKSEIINPHTNTNMHYSVDIEYEVYDIELKNYKINISNDFLPLLFVSLLIATEFHKKLLDSATQLDAYELLKNLKGCGNFIAYQLYVDLTYIKEFSFSENEFVVAGPGCYYGTELLMEDKSNFNGMTCEEVIFWIRDNIHKEFERLNLEWNTYELFSDLPEYDRCLNVMMIENCLCEFQKYWTLNVRFSGHVRRYKAYEKEI